MNIEKFASNFRSSSILVVPKVFRDYTSKRVITMEFIDGTHVSEMNKLRQKQIDGRAIADKGTKLVLEQIFVHGYFHADPHPGNIMVLDDSRICFLDFGMMGLIPPKHRNYLSTIMVGVINQDAEITTKALLEFSKSEKFEKIDELEYELFVLAESY